MTHSGSIKFAIKQIIKHVFAISNHEIILGHVFIAYSVIHLHESILTSKFIQDNPNINSAEVTNGSEKRQLGAGNLNSGAAVSKGSGTLWKQSRWPSGIPCGGGGGRRHQSPCRAGVRGSHLVKMGWPRVVLKLGHRQHTFKTCSMYNRSKK